MLWPSGATRNSSSAQPSHRCWPVSSLAAIAAGLLQPAAWLGGGDTTFCRAGSLAAHQILLSRIRRACLRIFRAAWVVRMRTAKKPFIFTKQGSNMFGENGLQELTHVMKGKQQGRRECTVECLRKQVRQLYSSTIVEKTRTNIFNWHSSLVLFIYLFANFYGEVWWTALTEFSHCFITVCVPKGKSPRWAGDLSTTTVKHFVYESYNETDMKAIERAFEPHLNS